MERQKSGGKSNAQVMTCAYRFFAAADRLLYVGVADDFEKRRKDHMKKPWWPQVARTEVIWFTCRLDALYEESRAIDIENPTHNRRAGISPVGLSLFRVRGHNGAMVSRSPVIAATKWEKDDAFRAVEQGRAHGWVTYEGAKSAIAIPIPWYVEACKRMGVPVDLTVMPQLNWEDL